MKRARHDSEHVACLKKKAPRAFFPLYELNAGGGGHVSNRTLFYYGGCTEKNGHQRSLALIEAIRVKWTHGLLLFSLMHTKLNNVFSYAILARAPKVFSVKVTAVKLTFLSCLSNT